MKCRTSIDFPSDIVIVISNRNLTDATELRQRGIGYNAIKTHRLACKCLPARLCQHFLRTSFSSLLSNSTNLPFFLSPKTSALSHHSVALLTEIEQLNASLSKWTSRDSRGKKRADSGDDYFSIKWVFVAYSQLLRLRYIFRCVGLSDSIGSVGLPEELTNKSPSTKSILGFPDNQLGEHIERTYHALAINENRLDFVRNCTLVVTGLFVYLFILELL
jgi:hypothetical protein